MLVVKDDEVEACFAEDFDEEWVVGLGEGAEDGFLFGHVLFEGSGGDIGGCHRV